MDETLKPRLALTLALSEDELSILYRPRLRPITKSVTGTILLQQMIYRARSVGWRPFYKFRRPCQHQLYQTGQSWCEELGFTPSEFDSALRQIGTRVRRGQSKTEAMDNLAPQGLVIYWTDARRVTWYQINTPLLEQYLLAVFEPGSVANSRILNYLTNSRIPNYQVIQESRITRKFKNPELPINREESEINQIFKDSVKNEPETTIFDFLEYYRKLFPTKPKITAPNGKPKTKRFQKLESLWKTRWRESEFRENWRTALQRAAESVYLQSEEAAWFTAFWFLGNGKNGNEPGWCRCYQREFAWRDRQIKTGNGRNGLHKPYQNQRPVPAEPPPTLPERLRRFWEKTPADMRLYITDNPARVDVFERVLEQRGILS